jgi:hypothetical protein
VCRFVGLNKRICFKSYISHTMNFGTHMKRAALLHDELKTVSCPIKRNGILKLLNDNLYEAAKISLAHRRSNTPVDFGRDCFGT